MKLTKIQALGILTESTQGTAVVPNSATDYLPVLGNVDFNVNPEILERDVRRSSLDNLAHIVGKRWVQVKFTTELKGSGTAGTAYAPLESAILACGFVKPVTTTGIASVTVTAAGTAFTTPPAIGFTGGGTGATAIAFITPGTGTGGGIGSILVTNPGTGYTAPTVTITGGGGSGATATAVASSNNVYYGPTSTAGTNMFSPGKTCTIEIYKGVPGTSGSLKKIVTGCVGTFKLMADAGQYPKLEFTFNGSYNAVTDATIPTPTLISQLPVAWSSAVFGLNGWSIPVMTKMDIDIGNTLTMRDDAGSANSIKGFMITDRNPKGSVEVEQEGVTASATATTTHDFFGKLIASTEFGTGFQFGATAGNIVTVGMPKTQYNDVADADKNNLAMFNVPFAINQNTGDDSIGFLLT